MEEDGKIIFRIFFVSRLAFTIHGYDDDDYDHHHEDD